MMNDRLARELADVWENESVEAADPARRETLRECVDALRMMADAKSPVIDTTLQPTRSPTHRCTICGAFWMEWATSWSLCSKECGQCCDNAAMGDQIAPLVISDVFVRKDAGDAQVVAWMRSQAATWERLMLKSEARGPDYHAITQSQALIAASYTDHADAIERGDHLASAPPSG